VIEHELAQGTDMIINLAAGLDARPYRMKFPPALRWVEVDLPEMLEYKQGVLASDRPQCALERVPLDLRDVAARRALFQRLGNEARRALLISEGLIVYLDEEAVAELARDLAAPPSFRRWATDLISPALLKMLRKSIGVPLQGAGSPLIFAPRQGPDFFAGYGWRPLERHSLLKAGARLHRLSLGMRLVSLLPDPAGRKPDTPWGGVCVFENTAAARP
jgi:methyltransferase (TIGR00027 family)